MARTVDIIIRGDAKSAIAALAATESAAIKTETNVGRALGRLQSSTRIKLGLGLLAAAGAASVGLIQLGKDFKDATNTIRVGTGATGKALDGLKADFRAVVSEVPASFGNAATAIADLNTRLGLTGKPLQEVSQNFLTLSRITKTELPTNIQNVTRLFNDWGITQEQMVPTMDKLFRASQSTGIGIDRLSQLMVDFGSPLRQLGVDFDFATAMFSNFERAGVATEKLMPGIRIALKTLGGAMPQVTEQLKSMGINTENVEQGFIDAFNAIKNASSTAEAAQISFKVFGVRAGPDMAAAIREGRFEIEDLMGVITSGTDTIRQAGQDTLTFTERWQLFKNRVAVRLEPLATKMFDAFERGLEVISNPRYLDAILAIGAALSALAALAIVVKVISAIAGAFIVLKGVALAIGGALFAAASAVLFLLTPIGLVTVAVLFFRDKIVSGFRTVRDGILAAIGAVVDFFQGSVIPFFQRVWNALVDPLRIAFNVIKGIFTAFVVIIGAPIIILAALIISHWSKIQTATSAIWTAISAVLRFVWREISGFISASVANVRTIITVAWDIIRTVTTTVWNAIAAAVRFVWEQALLPIWNAINAFVRTVLAPVFTFLQGVVSDVWSAIQTAIEAAWHFIRDRIFKPIGTFITDTVIPAFESLRDRLGDIWNSIRSGASSAWSSIVETMRGPINTIIRFINSLIGGLNTVLEKIPGIGFSIPEIPELRAPSGPPATSTRAANALARAGRASGGLIDVTRFGPFTVDRPMAVVGEGNPRHPEFVVPTDPAHRGRAMGLFDQLGHALNVPGMAIGGVLGDLFDKGKGFVGGLVDRAGGFLGGLARKALTTIFSPVNAAVKAGLNSVPNVMHMRDVAQGVRESVWQWVQGADAGLPAALPTTGGGLPRGKGIAGLRDPVASVAAEMLRRAGGAIWIVSGWRSTAQQARLYQRWLARVPGQARAAPPGRSKHERGLAVDWGGIRSIYQSLARSLGAHFPVSGEPWHMEVPGYRMGGIVDRFGFVHPGEAVLTHADQLQFMKLIRSGGSGAGTVIHIHPGAFVLNLPANATEEQARRLSGAQAKGFLDVVAQRRVMTDARIP